MHPAGAWRSGDSFLESFTCRATPNPRVFFFFSSPLSFYSFPELYLGEKNVS